MRKRTWLRWVVILAVVLVAASAGFSRALQGAAARRYLISQLEVSFGRPVDVGRFDFSLLNGAQLEAQSVTVAEDPQFGNEYFLRTESLTAGLRWSALLSGRIEFGSVSLTRPSLNLVRDSQGRWNIEQWLPPVPAGELLRATTARAPARSLSPERLDEIHVDGGRINFKRGEDKSEFALLDVSGSAEQQSPGRWQLDLEATPLRVGVELQKIGTLRLRGIIGGASARLQPAELNLTWRDVSLADALRLANHSDYGMRGTMNLELNARVAPASAESSAQGAWAQWNVSGVARLQGIHGWRLPPRDPDPAANLAVEAAWRLGKPQVTMSKLLLEMPNSHLQASGGVEWSHGLNPNLRIETSSVGFADLAAFLAAFHPGVAQDLSVQGSLGMDATLSGWPLQLKQAAITSAGGVLTASSLPGTFRVGPIRITTPLITTINPPASALVRPGGAAQFGGSASLVFGPTEISFVAAASRGGAKGTAIETTGHPTNSFTIRGGIQPDGSGANRWPPLWKLAIDGATPRVQDWSLLEQALGQSLSAELAVGWKAAGGVSVSLRGLRSAYPGPAVWSGTVDTHTLIATSLFLNQPLRLPSAHAEFSASQLILNLSGTQALGTTWRGTVSRKAPGTPWAFELTADSLDVADLDRWLGPRARSGLLAALGLSLAADPADPQGELREASIAGLSARGHLHVGELVLAPLRLDNFDGDVEVAGRNILVHKAQAGFFSGQVEGSFEARLKADASYRFQGNFDHVDLARLGRALPSLGSRFSGTASATLNLTAHGVGRSNLTGSLDGSGQFEAHNAEMQGLDLSSVDSDANLSAASSVFASAKGNFRITNGAIVTDNFLLADSSRRFRAQGSVDFSRLLTFQIRALAPGGDSPASALQETFVLAGTVDAPQLTVTGATDPPSRNAADPVRAKR